MNDIARILAKLKAIGCVEMKEATLLHDAVIAMANELELYGSITPADALHVLNNPASPRYCKDPKCKTGASNTPCYRVRRVLEQIGTKPGEVTV